MLRSAFFRAGAASLALLAAPGHAQPAKAVDLPAAIYRDPPQDKAHPARMVVLHIPSGGVEINGVAYLASGKGPHPTVVICHGLPGNEKNLDLAQALRRAGWNAITFNYRGSWGSPGKFRFAQNPEDLRAVLAYLRDGTNAEKLGIDAKRMAVAGHSMGGWVTAMAGSQETGLAGLVLISAADFGAMGRMDRPALYQHMADDLESLAGTTPEAMTDEILGAADANGLVAKAGALAATPMLVLSSDDGLAPQTDALVAAIRTAGGTRLQAAHVGTDHSWSDKRIELGARVIRFLEPLFKLEASCEPLGAGPGTPAPRSL
jgi:uncharacterized protein